MSVDNVLVILTCYSRPQNMPQVIKAWRAQSVPVKIVVVDNRPNVGVDHGAWAYFDEELQNVDDVWRWTENSGCPCWLAPAAMLSHKYKYIVRADDDFLPGTKAVEWMLKTANQVEDKFAAIGESGRILQSGQYQYGDAPRLFSLPRKVDNVVRGCMVLSEEVPMILRWRNVLAKYDIGHAVDAGNESKTFLGRDLVNVHDDLLTSTAIQQWFGYPTYVTPLSDDPEHLLIKTELPGDSAVHRRLGHKAERQAFIDLATANGWRSLV